MSVTTFDTLEFDKKLLKAGFSEKQAETLTYEIAKIFDEKIVTKDHLDVRLSELKTELVKWVLGVATTQAGIIIAFISLLKFLH